MIFTEIEVFGVLHGFWVKLGQIDPQRMDGSRIRFNMTDNGELFCLLTSVNFDGLNRGTYGIQIGRWQMERKSNYIMIGKFPCKWLGPLASLQKKPVKMARKIIILFVTEKHKGQKYNGPKRNYRDCIWI